LEFSLLRVQYPFVLGAFFCFWRVFLVLLREGGRNRRRRRRRRHEWRDGFMRKRKWRGHEFLLLYFPSAFSRP